MNDKININGKDFTIEELNALIEEVKKPKFVNEGSFRVYLDSRGCWDVYNTINNKFKNWNKTKEEAERHAKYFQLFTDMYFFAKEHNEGWIPNWNDDEQIKYGIRCFGDVFSVDWYSTSNIFLFGISFKSEELARKALEKFRDKLTDYLNIQQ